MRDKWEWILVVVVKVFVVKGFYCVWVSEVVWEVGVVDGMIYLYFSSKEEILWGLFEENMCRLIDGLFVEIVKESSYMNKMICLVDSYC